MRRTGHEVESVRELYGLRELLRMHEQRKKKQAPIWAVRLSLTTPPCQITRRWIEKAHSRAPTRTHLKRGILALPKNEIKNH